MKALFLIVFVLWSSNARTSEFEFNEEYVRSPFKPIALVLNSNLFKLKFNQFWIKHKMCVVVSRNLFVKLSFKNV